GAGGGLVLNALVLRLPLAVLACLTAVAMATFLTNDPVVRGLVYLLCLFITLSGVGDVLVGALQGIQAMRDVAAVDVLSKGTLLLAAVLFLHHGAGLVGLAVAWNLSAAVMALVALFAAWRRGVLAGHPNVRGWHSLLSGSLPFFTWQAALMIYGQIDFLLLSYLADPTAVGWYAAAYRIIGIPMFVPGIVTMVVFPALAACSRDAALFNQLARRALQVVALLGLPMAVGVMLLPDKLMDLFGYPDEFRDSVVPIVLLAPGLTLIGLDMVIGTVLNACDRQRQWAMTAVAAAVLNPLLNLVLIPYTQTAYGNGAIGAAVVTTLTEVFMLAVGLRLLPARVFTRGTLVHILKCLLAAAAMAVAVGLSRELPLLVVIPLGALVYGVACLRLGTVTFEDWRQLRAYLVRRAEAQSWRAPLS
ncbi:MAG TPA: flippase, partial [Chloroflexota bacterium]|nr:flippase [Chloroflexota bacterium]